MHASPIPPRMLADLDRLGARQLETLRLWLRVRVSRGERLGFDGAELVTAVETLCAERADPIRGPVRAAVVAAYADNDLPAEQRPAWKGLYALLDQIPESEHPAARALYDSAYGCTITMTADAAADLIAGNRRWSAMHAARQLEYRR